MAAHVRWPGLQGLRGVAVLAVLLYHHDAAWLPGGFLGVSLFFTLSGFLITGLLLREIGDTGGVGLRRFWARRARRLLPVSLVGLVLAVAAAPLLASGDRLAAIRLDVVAAMADVANWRFAFAAQGYGAAFEATSPVVHYWSLAIEEQFYVALPLLVLAARRRTVVAVLLAAIAAASLALQLTIDDTNRVYLGTDTRALELAAGGLLACWWTAGRRVGGRLLDRLAPVVGVPVVASWALVELTSPGLYRGGFALVACASAVLVLAAIAGPRTAAALGWRPLAAVGDHSYAVYVLHLPIFLVLDADRVGVDGPALLAVRLAVTAVVAVAVHAVVERPVHLGGALPGRVGRLGLATAFAAVAVFAVAMPRVDPTLDERDLGELLAIGGEGPTVLTAPSTTAPSAGVPASPADPAVVPADADLAPGDVAAPSATTAPGSAPTSVPPAPAPRLLVVGDSTALVNGAAMQEWGARTGRVEVDVVGAPACSFFQEGDIVYREGWQEAPSPACLNLLDRIEDVAADRRPDAIVLFIGSAQLADRVVPGTSTRTAMGDPAFDAAYDTAAGAALARLAALGPPVLWATVPTPAWVPEMTVPNTDLPGDGPVTMNDAGRAARLRELDGPLAAAAGIEVVPYAEHLTRPDGTVDPRLRPDGLHLAVDAVHEAMDSWLEAELRAAFNRAAGDADVRATTWTVPSG